MSYVQPALHIDFVKTFENKHKTVGYWFITSIFGPNAVVVWVKLSNGVWRCDVPKKHRPGRIQSYIRNCDIGSEWLWVCKRWFGGAAKSDGCWLYDPERNPKRAPICILGKSRRCRAILKSSNRLNRKKHQIFKGLNCPKMKMAWQYCIARFTWLDSHDWCYQYFYQTGNFLNVYAVWPVLGTGMLSPSGWNRTWPQDIGFIVTFGFIV